MKTIFEYSFYLHTFSDVSSGSTESSCDLLSGYVHGRWVEMGQSSPGLDE